MENIDNLLVESKKYRLKEISNARELLFDKFGDIEFEEEAHRYFIDGDEYTPVSTVISQFENEFETELIAENYSIKHNLNKDDVLRSWKWKNLKSTVAGSRHHEYGESFTWLKCGFPDKITPRMRHQYIEDEGWLVPCCKKEESVKQFYDELHPSIIPVGAEFKLSSKYMKGISTRMCGTADLLFYYDHPTDKSKNGFIIGDWKTNRELISSYNRKVGRMMKTPFDDMIDEALNHYALQFSCYQLMMESVGIKVIARRLVWLKEDGYEVFNMPDKTREMKSVL